VEKPTPGFEIYEVTQNKYKKSVAALLQFTAEVWHLTIRVGETPDETHNANLDA
jgi:hypothetical protein